MQFLLAVLHRILELVGLGRAKPHDPPDPYADVMAPVRRSPPGRSGAVALLEPEDDGPEKK